MFYFTVGVVLFREHSAVHLSGTSARWLYRVGLGGEYRTQRGEGWHPPACRALCRITLLPVTHVLVDTWMLTVKPVYKLLNVSDDLKWTTHKHVTPFSLTFKA